MRISDWSSDVCSADLGGIESHRLRVEEAGAENLRMPAFEPAGRIGDESEARRMAFGKAIAAEAFELPEGLLGEFGRIAALDHAGDQLLLELRDPAGVLESRHSAAELIDRKSTRMNS